MAEQFELKGKRVLVIGLARTGIATALFCAQRGAAVTAFDSRAAAELGNTPAQLRSANVQLHFGEPSDALLHHQQLLIPSPGVPADAPLLLQASKQKIPVWSEIELAFRFLQGRLIGITGSNGKTTTTALIDHILRHAAVPTILAGNIGTPLIARVNESAANTTSVVELSSFQLELIEVFRPNISVLLNLTPDHLDRHHTFAAYSAAKARIFENQIEADYAILNLDDPASLPLAPSRPHLYWFSRKTNVAQGAFVHNGKIIFRQHDRDEEILPCNAAPLPGAHNLENILGATIAARLAGVSSTQIAEAIRSFPGVEHRIEFVTAIDGVRYFNDSKATNVDATLKALQAFPCRIIVILGGKDKDSDYTQLRDTLREKAILALLIGSASQKIARQIEGCVAIQQVGTLEHAVSAAAQSAHPGDIVLLSPACASFDQFQNYEQRGRLFKEFVHQLPHPAQENILDASGNNVKNPTQTEQRNAETFGK
jgi:UDP-N-acetylmuramoylalanine--D-glutamate ligase